MSHGGPADHITPYDRMALSEATLVALLASRERHEGLVEYFGEQLHADLVKLARASQRPRARPGRRVYVLPGIMGSQLGFVRGGQRPNDIIWLDPIDINFGRLSELKLTRQSEDRPLGAMSYSYLKLTLSLRKAGFDAVLLDYDWRHDLATLGKLLAERIATDGHEQVALLGHSMGGLVARAALTHAAGSRVLAAGDARHPQPWIGGSRAGAARHLFRGTQAGHARPRARRRIPRERGVFEFSGRPRTAAVRRARRQPRPVQPGDVARAGSRARTGAVAGSRGSQRRLAPADSRFHVVVGCNRVTATRVALREGDFEYTYSMRGDGTGADRTGTARWRAPPLRECDHSDMPLSDRIIAGTIDLLKTGKTRRFAATPRIRRNTRRRVRDAELRREYQGKVDWPHMSPEERRLFLDNLNEPPRSWRA